MKIVKANGIIHLQVGAEQKSSYHLAVLYSSNRR